MKGYKAVLFSLDGDWTVDFSAEDKEGVREKLSNRGSLWFFHPIEGIILDKGGLTTGAQRILEMPEPFEHLIGKSIKTASRFFEQTPEVAQLFS